MKIIDPTQINQDAEAADFISGLLYDNNLSAIVLFPQGLEITRTTNDGMTTTFKLKYSLIRRQFAHKRGYCYEILNDDKNAIRERGGFGQVYKSLGKIVFFNDGKIKLLPSPHVIKSQLNLAIIDNEYFIGAQIPYLEAKPITKTASYSVFGNTSTSRAFSVLRCLGRELGPITVNATTLTEFMFLAISIANAVRELHGLNIVHGDIKPANLVKKAGVIRLIDMGGSRMHGAPLYTPSNTRAYMAPELFPFPNITFESDLYALGVTLWDILSNGKLNGYTDRSIPPDVSKEFAELVMRESLDHLPPGFVKEFKEIILKLTARQPEARLKLTEVISQLYALEAQFKTEDSDYDAAYAEGRALAQSYCNAIYIDWLELTEQIDKRFNALTERYSAPQCDALAMVLLKGLPLNAFAKKVTCIDDARKILKYINVIYKNLGVMGEVLDKLNSPAFQFLDKEKARFYVAKIKNLLQKNIRADYDVDRILKLAKKIQFLHSAINTFINQSLAERLPQHSSTNPRQDKHGFFRAPATISKSRGVQTRAGLGRG